MRSASIVVAAIALTAAPAPAAPDPPCFGAAARDPERGCENPRLRYSVVPAPAVAQIEPSEPCTPVGSAPDACAFGTTAARAKETIALVGDSHAVHWRAPLAVIARKRRWHGVTLYRSSCPFTAATSRLPEPERSRCTRWAGQVVQWFARHPAVRTMFVSQHSRGGVLAPPGQDQFDARVRGYIDVWKALPATVQHVVVLRDPPYIATNTLSCVKRAIRRHREAGTACALPRDTALRPDPATVAVERMRSPRVHAIDLTDFMCDAAQCYPVVGGVLVKKDAGHLTKRFATTLAPYLRRAFGRLAASWR